MEEPKEIDERQEKERKDLSKKHRKEWQELYSKVD